MFTFRFGFLTAVSLSWCFSAHAYWDFSPCRLLIPQGVDHIPSDILTRLATPFSRLPDVDATIERATRADAPLAAEIPASELLEELYSVQTKPFFDTDPENPNAGFMVFLVQGKDVPKTIDELGRLREERFRQINAGTGLARDIDPELDYDYYHFIVWQKNPMKRRITGAYRMTMGDRTQLYTSSQFAADAFLTPKVRAKVIELSRSFVRYDARHTPTLKILLRCIGEFMAQNPRYKYLIGSASIPDSMRDNSKLLMEQFFMTRRPHSKASKVQPLNPPKFRTSLSEQDLDTILANIRDIKDLQTLVKIAEDNQTAKIPQLLGIYHDVGATFLGFNHDVEFKTVDGLLLVDVSKIPLQKLTDFMAEDDAVKFLAYHRPWWKFGFVREVFR